MELKLDLMLQKGSMIGIYTSFYSLPKKEYNQGTNNLVGVVVQMLRVTPANEMKTYLKKPAGQYSSLKMSKVLFCRWDVCLANLPEVHFF